MTTTRPRLALLAAAALLGGCGLTLPWDSTPEVTPVVEFRPASIAFTGHVGGTTPVSQYLYVRVQPAWLNAWVSIEDYPNPVTTGSVTLQDDGWTRWELIPVDLAGLAEGTHPATVKVYACDPVDCTPGAPLTVPVTYTIGPRPLAVSPLAVAFEQVLGGPLAPPQAVALTGPATGEPWTTSLEFYGREPWVTVTPSGGTDLPADLQLQVTGSGIATGQQLTATLRVTRGDVSDDVLITLVERYPDLTASPAELFFTAVEGQPELPAAQQVSVGTVTGAGTPFYAQSPDGWWLRTSQAGTAPATVPVFPAFTSLAPGRYDATLGLYPTGGYFGTPGSASVLVHYDVLPRALAVAPATLRLDVDGDTTLPALSRTVDVSAPSGLSWTVEAPEAWLDVAPTGGTGPGTFTVTLPPAALAARPDGPWGGRAVVRFTDPNAGPLATTIHFDVSVNLPWLRTLQPRIAVASSTAAFHVRPLGAGSALEILFDGVAGAAAPPALDGTVLVTPPPLAPGRWPVTIRNGLGIAWQPVFVDVVAPASRAGASAPSAGRKGSIAFDDAAGRLFVANPGAGRVERYDETTGWARTERAAPGLADAALTPDGREVILVTADGARRLDAAALDGPLVAIPGGFGTFERTLPWRLALAADGRGLVVTPERGACLASPYDCGLHEIDASAGSGAFWLSWVAELADGWSPAMPEDRSAIWLLRHGALAPEAPRRWRPLGYGLDQPSPVVFDGTALDLDRHGTRALLLDVDPLFVATEGRLADLAVGLLPGTLPPTTAAALLSQDGTRAVTFDGLTRTVRIFDLAAAPDAVTGRFLEVGAPGGFAPPADPGAAPTLALSTDERTLFLSGDAAVVICPLP